MSDVLARLPLFADRRDAGRLLALGLEPERGAGAVVVGLARGGVVVAAEVADRLGLPLDVVAVRKVGHPWQPEYAIGAVTPGDGVYVRSADGLTDDEVRAAVDAARTRAAALDARLHEDADPVELDGRTCILVDDGLATGATMIAALRWARARGAARTVAAVPVGPHSSVALIASEADAVVCLHEPDSFSSVGLCYGSFDQVEDGEVKRLLAASPARAAAPRA